MSGYLKREKEDKCAERKRQDLNNRDKLGRRNTGQAEKYRLNSVHPNSGEHLFFPLNVSKSLSDMCTTPLKSFPHWEWVKMYIGEVFQ